MENLERLELNNRYKELSSVKKRYKNNVKRKSYILNFSKIKRNLIILNSCIIASLFILLGVGYSEQVNISSDNVILKKEISELSSQVSSLNQMAQSYNSTKRIEKIAESSLDMMYPNDNDIVKTEKTKEKLITLNDFLIEENDSYNTTIYTVLSNIFE